MKNKHRNAFLITSLSLFGAAYMPEALAISDFYMGAGAGMVRPVGTCSALGGPGFDGECDKKELGFKIVGGYKFSTNLSVELGYVRLGEFKAQGSNLSGPATAKVKTKGWQLMGIGMFEVDEDVWLMGKLGGFRWNLDTSGPVGLLTTGQTSSGTSMVFGIGLQVDVNRHFSVRGEWERYFNIGKEETTGEYGFNLLSVSGLWRF